jgi:hypothetical protein
MKKKLLKIVASVLVFAAMIAIYCWANATPKIESGSIRIIISNNSDHDHPITLSNDVWTYESSEDNPITLHAILALHYEIVVDKGMLIGVNGLMADNTQYFWKIWINCEMANRGIDALSFKDGDEIRLVYTPIGDYNNHAC